MTTPSEPENGQPPPEGVDLTKQDPAGEMPFDPYRFGKPDHPIPAEYAPPGYTGPVVPTPSPYPPPNNPWALPGDPYATPQQPYQQPYQPYPYPPPQPGAWGPAPPPYHGYAQPNTGNGKAIAALVLGILSIVFSWLFFFDGVFVIPGVIFALIAMSETKAPGSRGRGMAVAGLICSIVGAAIATVLTVLLVQAANQCGGFGNSNVPGFNTCVRDNFG